MTFADEIRDVIRQCRDYTGRVPFAMPTIIEILESMLSVIEAGQWESRDRRTGLGYMVLDDYGFAQTDLGLRLCRIGDVWCGDSEWEEVQ